MSRERWLVASLTWAAAGFLFPFLTPATALLSEGPQRSLIAALWRSVAGRAVVPGRYVLVSLLAASVGVLGELARL